MTMVDSLAISIPTLLTIFGLIISFQNFKLNKKKADKAEAKEDAQKVQDEEKRQKDNELRLVSIEKDVQYIRMSIDKFDQKIEDHEKRITKLETKKKGGR